jgi:hypothetical protein
MTTPGQVSSMTPEQQVREALTNGKGLSDSQEGVEWLQQTYGVRMLTQVFGRLRAKLKADGAIPPPPLGQTPVGQPAYVVGPAGQPVLAPTIPAHVAAQHILQGGGQVGGPGGFPTAQQTAAEANNVPSANPIAELVGTLNRLIAYHGLDRVQFALQIIEATSERR